MAESVELAAIVAEFWGWLEAYRAVILVDGCLGPSLLLRSRSARRDIEQSAQLGFRQLLQQARPSRDFPCGLRGIRGAAKSNDVSGLGEGLFGFVRGNHARRPAHAFGCPPAPFLVGHPTHESPLWRGYESCH